MLDFRQAPPLSIPLRFMLTAPLFGIAGAALLFWAGADALQSRWHPVALAALHCFTAGFMLQAMIGALWQVMPVVGGVVIAYPAPVAGITHVGLTLGAVLLVQGMLGQFAASSTLLVVGAMLMGGAVAVLIAASLPGLVRTRLGAESARLLALALLGLAGTVAAGFMLAWILSGGESVGDVAILIDLHATWAFAGWGLPLVAAVALQFVPMFYMTPAYPRLANAYLVGLALALVLAGGAYLDGSWAMRSGAVLAGLLACGFAAATLSRFAHRRRPRRDATLIGWQLAMISSLIAVALLVGSLVLSHAPPAQALELAFGAQAVLGVFVTLIGAMLLRILPFLASLHLAAAGGGWRLDRAPGERGQIVQVGLQWLAAAAVALAAFVPDLARLAAALLLASQLALARNVWGFAWALRRAMHKAAHQ